MINCTIPNTVPKVSASAEDFTDEHKQTMPLIAQIPNFTVDIKRLQEQVLEIADKYPAVYAHRDPINHPTHKYGGWSVTSQTGDIYDGWQSHLGFKDGKFDNILAYKAGWRPRWFHTNKTPICTGYLSDIVDQVSSMGFYPCAIRIMESPPKCYLGMHADAPDNQYSIRLHIPIITDDNAYHVWYTDPITKIHMPADGSTFLIRTNVNHSAHNEGEFPRYHLVFDVWDTKGIIPEFKYSNIENAKKLATGYMKYCEDYISKENYGTSKIIEQ